MPPPLPPATREAYEARLAEAQRAYEHTPNDADSIIWLGRRTAYLGRYREAIAIFTEGIAKYPADARMYRHRGHRYLTVRELNRAVSDLRRADSIEAGKPDTIEPDGLPNARGIPTSTLQSNIRYHLGLAYYLRGAFERAVRIYVMDVAAAHERQNPDMLVASSHWLYMALRRLGKNKEAEVVLRPITAELPVIENGSYHRLLLMYKGLLPPDSLLKAETASVEDVTQAYGVATWHLYNGREQEAFNIYNRILQSPQWAAFGYLAAEAEVARKR